MNREDVRDEKREAFEKRYGCSWPYDEYDEHASYVWDNSWQAATASAKGKYLPVIEKLVNKATKFITDNGDLMMELADRIPEELESDEGADNLFDKAERAMSELQKALAKAAPLLRGK